MLSSLFLICTNLHIDTARGIGLQCSELLSGFSTLYGDAGGIGLQCGELLSGFSTLHGDAGPGGNDVRVYKFP